VRYELKLPDLGLQNVTVSLWLVQPGSDVTEGDRILEVMAEGVTVDLPAPATGVLAEQLVAEDDAVEIDQVLGVVVDDAK
jgi:pyruvate/2-oxoglutarate dehydrogenase complex dihydrolipoamide acyltransferase (E2) component